MQHLPLIDLFFIPGVDDPQVVEAQIAKEPDALTRRIMRNQLQMQLDLYAKYANSDRTTTDAQDDAKDLGDYVTDKALEKATPAVNRWVKLVQAQLKRWKKEGLTLQEIRDRLPELYTKLKSEQFAKALSQSMQLTYLGARAEVLDEMTDEEGQDV